ncbi:MAG: glycosyltransferase family 4 protein [Flavobacteriales bacterium]
MNTNRQTLLFITTEVPWPADSGGRIKTFRLVQFLAQHFEVRLLCAHGMRDKQSLTELRDASGIASAQSFDTFKPRTALNWFKGLMSFPTFNSFRVYSKQMESMMRWGVEQSDIVIVDHLEMMEMIPEKLVPKVIYHSHNAEFKLWTDMAKLVNNPIKKIAIEWEADRIKAFERWVIRKSKFTFAAPNDIQLLKEIQGVKEDKFRLTYHLGNETLLNRPIINLDANPHKVFYAGTLSWMPNHDGLMWFIRNCWKQVKSEVPQAELVVCGRGADSDLQNAIRHSEGIIYKGFVEDLEVEMSTSRCAIVPLRFGSGMKIKTFDAMYRGLPVVATSSGVEGIDVENGIQVFSADNSEAFSNYVIELLSSPELGMHVANEARELTKSKYTYPVVFGQMLVSITQ